MKRQLMLFIVIYTIDVCTLQVGLDEDGRIGKSAGFRMEDRKFESRSSQNNNLLI